ncbi:helix-turn-helix domain-containing protein [Candidatus Dependentiae bacterium]|nr:helix-turn-helix domain-containing protein [Candidatus Dependentiae bacterium]MCC7414936.1 helix-turn-helix domain-containing protein [Campylobacterota bacterium]
MKTKSYEEYLLKTLQDPEEALGYLNAALADEDPKVFLLALKHVLRAQRIDFSAFADETNISRQNVYRIVSEAGNPRWNNLNAILDVMGLQLRVEPKSK